MKKNFFYIAALAVITAACTNEDSLVTVPTNNSASEGKMITETITATNGDANGTTRVAIADTDGAFSWSVGDQIAVHVSDGKYYTTEALTASNINSTEPDNANFTVSYPDGESRDAFAVFPASIVASDAENYGQSGKTLDVTLPASYTLAEVSGTTTPCPMIADNTGSGWEFYQLCGMLRLTIIGIPAEATSMVIQFPGKKVNGTFSVTNPSSATPTIATGTPADGEDKITVTFDAGTTEAIVNIPLPTGDYTDVTVTAYNGSDAIATKTLPLKEGGYTAKRAHAKKLITPMVDSFKRFDLSTDNFNDNTVSYAYIYQSTSGTATSNTITIADGQKVILDGVNIEAVNDNAINCLGNATIVLSGTNTVANNDVNKAVIKAGTYDPMTTLIFSGAGKLTVTSNYTSLAGGAVIGSDSGGKCGNIVISNGKIEVSAKSELRGAAIGAGSSSDKNSPSQCGNITINGGEVKATSYTGAGIGSGQISSGSGQSSCGIISITGGKVTAISVCGAAIGSGQMNSNNTDAFTKVAEIRISGGTVEASTSATSNKYMGAAIGSGHKGKVEGDISIEGGNVTASCSGTSANGAAGIGTGYCGICQKISISGGSIEATGGNYAAGIGSTKGSQKYPSSCGTIEISSVKKVKATKGTLNADNCIGKGCSTYSSCGTVTIGGSTTVDTSGDSYTYPQP